MPLAIVGSRVANGCLIVSAVALDKETDFDFVQIGGGPISVEWPMFFRMIDELSGRLELDYLSEVDGELVGNRAQAEMVR